jgi:chromosome segregation ATPase
LAALEASNPFTTVLAEIKKMLGLLAQEEKVDQEQLTWCTNERETNNANLDTKKEQITALTGAIDELTNTSENPTTGFKFQIQETETSLEQNRKSQAENTADRKESNVAYQKDIADLVEAERLVGNAVSVLRKYYSKIVKAEEVGPAGLVQTRQEPPATWENDSYKGQSGQGGNKAIEMLEFILDESKKEEAAAHTDEADAQKQFEDTMEELTTQEAEKEKSLASLHKLLAEKEQTLLEKKTDLKTTEEEKAAIEAYLLKIKPGCDFITTNIAERTSSREQETEALTKATGLLKETPAYQTAVAEAHNETLASSGDSGCLEKCAGNEDHLKCKACLAKVTEPAYCAGHAGTVGC